MNEDRVIKKGDIYYANLDPIIGSEQNGTRPVVVVQNNLGNKYSPTVLIAPSTSKSKKKNYLPTHIEIKSNEKIIDQNNLNQMFPILRKEELNIENCKIP